MSASPNTAEEFLPAIDAAVINSPIAAWLVNHQGDQSNAPQLMDTLCRRLVAAGVQLCRVTAGLPTLHPQLFGRTLTWTPAVGVIQEARERAILDTGAYLNSPVRALHEGAAAVRRRLDGSGPDDYPILQEVRATGATDYLAVPMRFTRGQGSFVAWATDRPGGFSNDELALLSGLMPFIALRFEILATRRMALDLLTTYLGRDAAHRVLEGTVMRAQNESIQAAIWYCDLRGFTAMSDRMQPYDLINTLDDYLECMARPVQAHGGEVLKFIGDGMLAIFRVGDGGPTFACTEALDATLDAFGLLDELNQGRALEGGAPLRVGVALHLGTVIYGNIGATDRLDFTVIGRAVNEVSRLESQCKVLGQPLLMSAGFAEHCTARPLLSLGMHALRGVKQPAELFGIDRALIAGADVVSAEDAPQPA